MTFDCYYCGERKEIVTFIDDGFVQEIIGVKQRRPACRECRDRLNKTERAGLASKPAQGADDYPF